MTLAACMAALSTVVAIYVAALSGRFSLAPGWRDQRYFSYVALTVAAYSALNIPTTLVMGERLVVATSRAQFLLAALHVCAWIRYSSVHLDLAPGRAERALIALLLALGVIGAATPAAYPGGAWALEVPLVGLRYTNPTTTLFAEVALPVIVGSFLLPIARFLRALRRGVENAGLQLAALSFMLAISANDVLVVFALSPLPYLVDVGFLIPVAAVAFALTARFVEDARSLAALRAELEREVEARTGELTRTQEQLHRAEKLAAIGQFAAGVAHEVNNPAAVVSANLHYLEDNEAADLSDDGRDAVRESLVSVQRIAVIVRQLLDAGRLAALSEQPTSVALRPLAEDALRAARARCGRRVRLSNEVPEGLCASAQEGLLLQVLVNLVVNGAQAVPEPRTDGWIHVRAERRGARVLLVVDDNGAGMSPEILRRVFEPFFTTKPFGSGTGLGLAVSRGLVTGLGGDLRLESEVGVGTRAIVELAAAEARPAHAGAAAQQEAGPALRLLVVDDEAPVRSSLQRMLERRYRVAVAGSVDEGLALARGAPFDVLLCDLMMPAGGGERLYRTLEACEPALARRVVFFTGGAVTEAARRFLRGQPQPVLQKPLDPEQLARTAERVAAAAA